MESLRVIDYKIEDAECLNDGSGCIIVTNHPTLIDVILIGSALPQCCCIVKQEIWHNVFMRGVATAAGYIPNVNGPELLKRCEALLGERDTLLIFPEGTRSVPSKPIKIKRGAANLAVRLKRDLRLVHIDCEPATLLKGQKWYEIPHRRPFFHVRVKERIRIEKFLEGSPHLSIAARRLTEYLDAVLAPGNGAASEKDPGNGRPSTEGEGVALSIGSLDLDHLTSGEIVEEAPLFNEGIG
jgi:1-acyl-sn-glycerol-3-phosphate acyltransferase